MPLQVRGQQFRAAPHALPVALAARELPVGQGLEAAPAPGVLGDLDDERRPFRAVRVGVHLEHPEVEALDEEGEGVEDLVGGEPHVAGVPLVQLRPEDVGVRGAGRRVDAVGGDHQVVLLGELPDRRRGRAVADVHRQLVAAPLQDRAQPVAVQRREAVAAAGAHLPGVPDVDVAPARELGAQCGEHGRVGLGDAVQCLVGEHHSEAELVLAAVPFEDGDLPLRCQLPGQRGEVEPARTAADHRHPAGRSGRRTTSTSPGHGTTPAPGHRIASGSCRPAPDSARRTGSGQGSVPLACGAACTTDIRPPAAGPFGPCTSKA